jgi:hypothetical protein
MRFIKSIAVFMLVALSFTAFTAQAGDFAEQKVVLQVSDKAKQGFVLNVAKNLVKHYGRDQVSVEVVAFGPGLGLLVNSKKNKNAKRVASLAAEGVKFDACANTIKAMTRKNKGVAPKILSQATIVPAGVVQIIDLQNKGYKLIKP